MYYQTREYIGVKLAQLAAQQVLPGNDAKSNHALEGRLVRLRAAEGAINGEGILEAPISTLLLSVTGGVRRLVEQCVEDDISTLSVSHMQNDPSRKELTSRAQLGLKALEELKVPQDNMRTLRRSFLHAR
jgi:hypothetical protein